MSVVTNYFPLSAIPAWATAYGDDRFGAWAELELEPREDGDPIVQRFRWIEPGDFLMGSGDDEPERWNDEGPQHRVTISEGFWLADTACTQSFWRAVLKNDDLSRFKGDDRPVEQVSWERVQEFMKVLGELVPGCNASLPTEAEWEYACRAGTTTPFSFGANITPDQVNYDGNYPYADGAKGKSREQTVPVKSLPANRWGLFAMHGNVWEWCADTQRTYTAERVRDPRGPEDRAAPRVVRGGAWFDYARYARSACRHAYRPGFARDDLGFRLCLRSMKPQPGGGAASPAEQAGVARRAQVEGVSAAQPPSALERTRRWFGGRGGNGGNRDGR